MSRLDRETKLALLREAAGHDRVGHRFAAVEALEHLDPAAFRIALKSHLDRLAAARLSEREWENEVGTTSMLSAARRANDPGCWAALTAICRAAPVLFRMELIDRVFDEFDTRDPAELRSQLRFLVDALPDRTVRDAIARPVGTFPFPGHAYSRLAVGDFAALKLAEYLDIEVPWQPNRPADAWAELRQRVRTAAEMQISPK